VTLRYSPFSIGVKEAARRTGYSRPYIYKHKDEHPWIDFRVTGLGDKVLFDPIRLEAWRSRLAKDGPPP